MRAVVGIVLVCVALQASAAERTYAVLSLVGDKLTVARVELTTGSRLDRNARTVIETPGGELDRTMAFAIEDEIKRIAPDARVVLLGANDPALYAAQAAAIDGGVSTIMPALEATLRGAKASHLVLVTKHKGEARIPLDDGMIGSGALEGLGFYLDHDRYVLNRANGESSQGILAPYGYVRFSLVDLADSRTLVEHKATLAYTVSSQKAESTWQNLTPEEKVGYLKEIIRREAQDTVPKLVAR
jgi:hypothetical protein